MLKNENIQASTKFETNERVDTNQNNGLDFTDSELKINKNATNTSPFRPTKMDGGTFQNHTNLLNQNSSEIVDF